MGLTVTLAGVGQGSFRRGEAVSRTVNWSRVCGQVRQHEWAEGPAGRRPRGRNDAEAASLSPAGSAVRRLRDEKLHVPRPRNVCRLPTGCPPKWATTELSIIVIPNKACIEILSQIKVSNKHSNVITAIFCAWPNLNALIIVSEPQICDMRQIS